MLTTDRRTGETSGTFSNGSKYEPMVCACPNSTTTLIKFISAAALESSLIISAASSDDDNDRSATT